MERTFKIEFPDDLTITDVTPNKERRSKPATNSTDYPTVQDMLRNVGAPVKVSLKMIRHKMAHYTGTCTIERFQNTSGGDTPIMGMHAPFVDLCS